MAVKNEPPWPYVCFILPKAHAPGFTLGARARSTCHGNVFGLGAGGFTTTLLFTGGFRGDFPSVSPALQYGANQI
jgi:hypothetical protein